MVVPTATSLAGSPTQQLHFVTVSCYRCRQYLDTAHAKRRFVNALQEARRHYGMLAFGYVVMPSVCICW
jgi:hypothetical protein